jgi:hypothetical protein
MLLTLNETTDANSWHAYKQGKAKIISHIYHDDIINGGFQEFIIYVK